MLEVNRNIIKLLVEYQNNGWTSEPEHKLYQTRLLTNLTYLATLADSMMKDGDISRSDTRNEAMTGSQSPCSLSNVDFSNKFALPMDRNAIIDSLPPQTIIKDPINSRSRLSHTSYKPVPTFVGSHSNSATEMPVLPGYSVIEPKRAHILMKRRLDQAKVGTLTSMFGASAMKEPEQEGLSKMNSHQSVMQRNNLSFVGTEPMIAPVAQQQQTIAPSATLTEREVTSKAAEVTIDTIDGIGDEDEEEDEDYIPPIFENEEEEDDESKLTPCTVYPANGIESSESDASPLRVDQVTETSAATGK